MHRPSITFVATALFMSFAGQAGAQTPAGTWRLYPSQTSSYVTAVQQPINVDGTSNFKSSGNGVIPVKFSLAIGAGPVVFQSIGSGYSYLSFTPSGTLLFSDLKTLSAVYSFTQGNCHGGALRWQVRVSPTQSVFIYYGAHPNFTDCTTTADQSGVNMIDMPDLRYDTTQVGGTFYDTYDQALTLVGSMPIVAASLVLDAGWGGDQVMKLGNVTVNSNTFVPAGGVTTPTCDLPLATIQITKTSVSPSGAVNEPVTIQPGDDNSPFRIQDCKYMYNLATDSLSGPGAYKVEALINGSSPAAGAATFDLR